MAKTCSLLSKKWATKPLQWVATLYHVTDLLNMGVETCGCVDILVWCWSVFHNIFKNSGYFLHEQWTCLSKSTQHCKGFVAYCISLTLTPQLYRNVSRTFYLRLCTVGKLDSWNVYKKGWNFFSPRSILHLNCHHRKSQVSVSLVSALFVVS